MHLQVARLGDEVNPVAVITQDDGDGQLIERYRSKQKYDMNMQPSWMDHVDTEPTTQLDEKGEKSEHDELDFRVRRTASLILANAYPGAPVTRLPPQTSWTDHLYMERARNKLYVDKSNSGEPAGKPLWPTRDNPNNPSDDQDATLTKDYKVGDRRVR